MSRALPKLRQRYLALADYGPDAAPGRTLLGGSVKRSLSEIWSNESDENFVARSYGATIANLHSTETQWHALAAANQAVTSISQTRLQMAVTLTDAVSRPLVAIVVARAVFIFIGFGLQHASNTDSVVALAVGALAVSSAAYLVVDLSQPYSGIFQVSFTADRGCSGADEQTTMKRL
jgi:hypothetical protein